MADTYKVGNTQLYQAASPDTPVKISNTGTTVYYRSTSPVSSGTNDGSISSGSSKVFTAGQYLISNTSSNLTVTTYSQAADSPLYTTKAGHANFVPVATTTGTDTAGVDGTTWLTSIYIPTTVSLTGVKYLIGSVGGTDKVVGALYDTSGNVLANSINDTSVTVGTAATYQSLAFTSQFRAYGPETYYVGIQTNGTTAKLRTVPISATLLGGNVAGTFNTLTGLTMPTTFTADQAPIVATY